MVQEEWAGFPKEGAAHIQRAVTRFVSDLSALAKADITDDTFILGHRASAGTGQLASIPDYSYAAYRHTITLALNRTALLS